ncbi:MAG: homocysteine S-methyltransferase family protein [Desulfopila sp.]|jgi:S-methylmethionine-dependent homocysteine/selenocysteine methylase|nr:homocysteine S-methyltransferase family protein [Desulfopila sp.]
MKTDLHSLIDDNPLILTECAISERLRHHEGVQLHPTLFNTPLIYDSRGEAIMRDIYMQYRNIARKAHLPILLCAPTWRLDQPRLQEAGFDDSLLEDAVTFMRRLQNDSQDPFSPCVLGGLIGPKNDCYSPEQALSIEAAEKYHSRQIEKLAMAGVECIVAQTIPALSEAMGMALALASSRIPYIISFVINRSAEILDATPLHSGILHIDNHLTTPPLCYMVNCVYPTFLQPEKQPRDMFDRLLGIQANSSSLDHSQLDGSTALHQDDLQHWGDTMLNLNKTYGIKILGGCCGTDNRYLQYLVDNVIDSPTAAARSAIS